MKAGCFLADYPTPYLQAWAAFMTAYSPHDVAPGGHYLEGDAIPPLAFLNAAEYCIPWPPSEVAHFFEREEDIPDDYPYRACVLQGIANGGPAYDSSGFIGDWYFGFGAHHDGWRGNAMSVGLVTDARVPVRMASITDPGAPIAHMSDAVFTAIWDAALINIGREFHHDFPADLFHCDRQAKVARQAVAEARRRSQPIPFRS